MLLLEKRMAQAREKDQCHSVFEGPADNGKLSDPAKKRASRVHAINRSRLPVSHKDP